MFITVFTTARHLSQLKHMCTVQALLTYLLKTLFNIIPNRHLGIPLGILTFTSADQDPVWTWTLPHVLHAQPIQSSFTWHPNWTQAGSTLQPVWTFWRRRKIPCPSRECRQIFGRHYTNWAIL